MFTGACNIGIFDVDILGTTARASSVVHPRRKEDGKEKEKLAAFALAALSHGIT